MNLPSTAALLDALDHGAAVLDAAGRIVHLNPVARSLFDISASSAVGEPAVGLIPSLRGAEAELQSALVRRAPGRVDLAAGARRFEVHMAPLPDGGAVLQWHDVTQRRQAEDELERRHRELAAASRRKDEFLATLAHELRNPLAPLRTSLELQRRPSIAEETKERAREIMARQVTQMVRLIDELLDISRIGTGKIELVRERCGLRELVDAAVETVGPAIGDKDQRLLVELPDAPVWLHVDRARLTQVLCNLLGNASRYSERGLRIWLRAQADADGVTIAVRDEGIGIAPDKLHQVFRMFEQLDEGQAPLHGGLGIGLTLARRLVELHGGRVHGHSDGAGAGSEFAVRLPASALSGGGS
ncbi:MAG TPA: ATP-binding protein [Albitalea sp.]